MSLNKTIIYFPDTRECNDFITILEEYDMRYYLIGKESWKTKVRALKPADSYWVPDNAFCGENLCKIVNNIVKIEGNSKIMLISFHENNVILSGSISSKLGVHGIPQKTSVFFRDKWEMLNKVKKVGINIPKTIIGGKYTNVENMENVREFIIKPRMSSGSKGVFRMSNAEDVKHWFKNINPIKINDYIIQSFIEGEFYHIDGIVLENNTKWFLCGQAIESLIEVGRESRVFYKSITLEKQNQFVNKLKFYHDLVIKSFGLTNGCTHIEFFKTEEEWIFCEAAARPPAMGILRLHQIAAYESSVQRYGRLLSGGVMINEGYPNTVAGLIAFTPEKPVVSSDSVLKFNESWIVEKRDCDNLLEVIGGGYLSELGRIYIEAPDENTCINRLEKLATNFHYEINEEFNGK